MISESSFGIERVCSMENFQVRLIDVAQRDILQLIDSLPQPRNVFFGHQSFETLEEASFRACQRS